MRQKNGADTSGTLARVASLAALGEQVLSLVKASGLAKPKRRAYTRKAKPQAKPIQRQVRREPRPLGARDLREQAAE